MEFRNVCFEIENDDFYRQFLNEKQNAYSSSNISEKVEKLTKGIEKLNCDLETQVLSKHHDLLTQASHATNLEKAIDTMQIDAQSLLTGIEKLRSQVLIPYNLLENQTLVLSRVQTVCHILRHSFKMIQLSKYALTLDHNPPLQAKILNEVEQLIADNDFNGIQFLSECIEKIKLKRSQLTAGALDLLLKGLNNADKNLLISSFRILNSLHCAKEHINNIVTKVLEDVSKAISITLDVKGEDVKKQELVKSGPGKANVINMQSYRMKFWENMDKLFADTFYSNCKKIILLQSALNDIDSLENYHSVAKEFWEKLMSMFITELKNSPGYANQCVELDFPKLLKCCNDLSTKLNHKDFVVLRDLLSSWENYFLSKTLEKLLDPIRSMWAASQVPNLEEIDSVIRIISSALSVALGDKHLSVSLGISITKCIKQMSTEAEQRVCLENEAGQIIEAPSSAQQLNADISNVLYYFCTQILRVLNNMANILSPDVINIIQESLKEISNVSVLQPFYLSICAAVDLIIESMNTEEDLNKGDSPQGVTITPSLYLRELQQFIVRCKDIYFVMYHDIATVNKCCKNIGIHCIQTFVQNVCTLRPVSAYGRAKLQVDCNQLEIVLKPLISELSLLDCYRELRALHALLALTPNQIAESQSKGASLPYSLVMMMLFAFGESDLLSPHQCVGWSHRKLLDWLAEHTSERDRLEFIAGALQRYQNHVRQKNISKYDDVYLILLKLLEDGRKQC